MKKALGMLACATLMLGGCGKKTDKEVEPMAEVAFGEYDLPEAYTSQEYVFDDKAPAHDADYDYDELALYDDEDFDASEYDDLAWDDEDYDYDEYDLADADYDLDEDEYELADADYDFDEDDYGYDLAELELDDEMELADLDVDDDLALAQLNTQGSDYEDDVYEVAELDLENDLELADYDELAYEDDFFEFEPIQFAFDSDTLSRGQEELLEQEIELAHEAVEAGESIVIEAYGCQIGTENYNSPLTQRRAEAMKQRFVAAGIPADKVIARGMGQEQPLVWSDATERLQRIRELAPNRRVEISLAQ